MFRWATALAASVVALSWAPVAHGQCDPVTACTTAASSLFVGDLNADELVNAADMQVFEDCFLGSAPPVCRSADLNFDGVIDVVDKEYLANVISLSRDFGAPALPKVTLSEIRVRKPDDQTNPAIPESRYVEIRTPQLTFTVDAAVPGTPIARRFKEGWYYLKVCRTGPGAGGNLQTIAGTIAVVQDLAGMILVNPNAPGTPTNVLTRGLSLLADDSFAAPLSEAVPPSARPYVRRANGSLEIPTGDVAGRRFPVEWETNVTHLIVYRDPSSSNSRDRPAVGQRVNFRLQDGSEACSIAFDLSGSDLPPWDAIVDAVTLVRGSSVPVYGCVFAQGPAAFGPIGTVQAPYQAPHVYRCRNAGTLTRGPDAVVFIPSQTTVPASDTPFQRNPACASQPTNCGELSGDGEPRGCLEVHDKPFCSDPDCCIAVCTTDPRCCTVSWDATCVAAARARCITCGTAATSCFVVHPTPSCESSACCNAVCAVDPSCCDFIAGEWDQDCVQAARELCLGCGGLGAGSCDQVRDLPYCSDADCCNRVCEVLPACCSQRWDQACVDASLALCPGCGRPGAGSCCIIHGSPYCDNGDCCNAVCALDSFCCSQTWDFFCTRAATALPECEGLGCTCGNPAVPNAPFDCFVAHPLAGCADEFCCQSVCVHDPYCCFISWDDACVELAILECSTDRRCIDPVTLLPVTGSCFIAHPGSPGCDKPGCCSEVCAVPDFSYCCEDGWDEACAVRATDVCDNCGDPLAGSCYQAHVGPYCANADCCRTVCQFDPFCCEGTWDGLCVQTAETLCGGPLASCATSERSCFIPNYLPGCRGGALVQGEFVIPCCVAICTTIDPFCCDSRWDAVCAREAGALCGPSDRPDVPVGPGSCLEAHATPACSNEECSRAVCTVDPSCCATGGAWDVSCVLAAMAVCPSAGGCPAEGDCFSAHPNTAGCRDASCCNGVCSVDPDCCSVSWDATCASIADAVCMVPPNSGWSCPCAGNCFETHDNPGCDDGSCCAVVCNINPACCDASWTEDCTSFARTFCCGAPGCDSGCNKACLSVHPEPYCDDPFCCDAVCRADPLCCLFSWDSLCVTGAMERCAGACGLATAGDCFVPQAYGGCREASCCGRVCADDPICCSEEWDQVCVDLAIANPEACRRRECGEHDAGPSCKAHPNGASDNKECCQRVCAVDAYCCNVEWDESCVDIALGIEDCGCTFDCGDACAGNCCSPHDNPSCDDAECCDQVCAVDDYCCTVRWDASCAAEARNSCTGKKDACPLPPCGSDLLPSCCVPGNAPNCQNADCCAAVCQLDPFCCEILWDVVCSELAFGQAVCACDGPVCGDPGTGSCTEARTEPYCSDQGCCVFVCDLDPSCCAVAWDEECVSLAQTLCTNAIQAPGARKDPAARGRAGYTPPAGWMPVRQRMQQRRPYPVELEEDARPVTESIPVPRPADRSPSMAPGPMEELPEAGPVPTKGPAPQATGAGPAAPAGKKPGK